MLFFAPTATLVLFFAPTTTTLVIFFATTKRVPGIWYFVRRIAFGNFVWRIAFWDCVLELVLVLPFVKQQARQE